MNSLRFVAVARYIRRRVTTLALSPGGHLFVEPDDQAEPKLTAAPAARLTEAFAHRARTGSNCSPPSFCTSRCRRHLAFGVVWPGVISRPSAITPNLDTATELTVAKPRRERLDRSGRGRAADEGTGVLERRRLGPVVGGIGCSRPRGHCPDSRRSGGVSQELQSAVERRGAGHISSGGKQAQSGSSLRVSGHLYASGFRARQSAASAAGAGLGGIRRGQKPDGAGGLAFAGATRGGAEQTRPAIVGFPRHFSSAGLAAGAGLRFFEGDSPVRAKRFGGSHSRLVEGGPSAPSASERAHRRSQREPASAKTVCWISRWTFRWRANR